MSTNSKLWLVAALVAGLSTTQHARAFYNATSGRWLTRDPIEEDGGPNLYSFVLNAPPNRIDALGEITVGPGHKIKVDPCEIVILYGHGTWKPGNWKWTVPSGSCYAGAAVTCWPVANSTGLPEDRNLFTSWGKGDELEEFSPVNDPQILWGYPVTDPDFITFAHVINANKALRYTFAKAVRRAVDICKSCPDCENVRIAFVQINKKGEQVKPSREEGGVPKMDDITIPCGLCRKRL